MGFLRASRSTGGLGTDQEAFRVRPGADLHQLAARAHLQHVQRKVGPPALPVKHDHP